MTNELVQFATDNVAHNIWTHLTVTRTTCPWLAEYRYSRVLHEEERCGMTYSDLPEAGQPEGQWQHRRF